jgi:hypothetical protein
MTIFKDTFFQSDSKTPLYQALYNHMRAAILSGELAAGMKLPSTRALAEGTEYLAQYRPQCLPTASGRRIPGGQGGQRDLCGPCITRTFADYTVGRRSSNEIG